MLRELELKRPQLDELLSTAESLKAGVNRENLQGKGTYGQQRSMTSGQF